MSITRINHKIIKLIAAVKVMIAGININDKFRKLFIMRVLICLIVKLIIITMIKANVTINIIIIIP